MCLIVNRYRVYNKIVFPQCIATYPSLTYRCKRTSMQVNSHSELLVMVRRRLQNIGKFLQKEHTFLVHPVHEICVNVSLISKYKFNSVLISELSINYSSNFVIFPRIGITERKYFLFCYKQFIDEIAIYNYGHHIYAFLIGLL